MKKLILIVTVFIALSFIGTAQNVNIPDTNFKAYLVGNSSINTNSDTEIQVSEANAFTGQIDCSLDSILDLTGIEAFVGLTELLCYHNSLTSLDLSNNIALTKLNCLGNSLTSLNLNNVTALIDLDCSHNSLTSLDLSSNIALSSLSCNSNLLTNLDLSNNTYLTNISCNNNSLTSLDLSNSNALTSLSGWGNLLTSIDLSNNTALEYLDCSSNSITSLDISNNTALTYLSCFDNSITSLDVSNNTALTTLSCGDNLLSQLDVSNNTALTELYCEENSITYLDLSTNNALEIIYCYINSLTSLNVANGNNTIITHFYTYDNPNLTCIQVDDSTYSANNWTSFIEQGSSYSENCPVLVNSITIQGQGGDSTITTNGGTLQMEAIIFPANAEDTTYNWSVVYGTGSASISTTGLLTAITNGTVTVMATANDILGVTATYEVTISNQISQVTLVNSITVQGEGGVSTITTNGGTLQMSATVLPSNANDATYTWSVQNGTGDATISSTGLLTASADGTVEVVATANDASGTTGTKTITISNQSVGINDLSFENLSIFPNPTTGLVNLEIQEDLSFIRLFDLTGKTIKFFNTEATQLDISEFTSGIYFLEIANAERKSIIKIIKK